MSIALLFPGQGAQRPGFLHRLPGSAAINNILREAAAVLDLDPLRLDSAVALQSTVAVQLSIFIAGVATTRALAELAVFPDFVAGHSIGAFAAAVAAGVLTFADALRLVSVRARCMQEAQPQGFGMAALVGLSESTVRSIVGDLGGPQALLYISAINGPRQIVLSGTHASLALATHAASRAGAQRAVLLTVSVPSHCELLNRVSDKMRLEFQSIRLAEPRIRYICNHTARAAPRADDVREDLIRGVACPVLWHDSTTLLVELGARLFIEIPPGTVLTDLVRSAFPELQTVAIDNAALESAVLLAARMRDDRYG